MKTLFHTLLVLLGALLILVSPLMLVASEEFEVQPMSVESLEQGEAPPGSEIRVTGGRLYWPAGLESYKEHMRTGERTSNGWFLPLVSAALAAELDQAAAAGEPLSLLRCRVLAHLPADLVEERFAQEAAAEASDHSSGFELVGSCKQGRAVPLHIKKEILAGCWPMFDLTTAIYVEHGSDTEPWQVSLALFGFGAFLFWSGFSRLRRRRAERLVENSSVGSTDRVLMSA